MVKPRRYNFNNGHCRRCDEFVAKGNGVWHEGWVYCLDCHTLSETPRWHPAMQPRYPYITVQLTGADGNGFNILALCHQAMLKAGFGKQDRDVFTKEATSGDYDHLIQTAMRWFTVQ